MTPSFFWTLTRIHSLVILFSYCMVFLIKIMLTCKIMLVIAKIWEKIKKEKTIICSTITVSSSGAFFQYTCVHICVYSICAYIHAHTHELKIYI